MKDLTILIPSYNRQGYLRRQLAFWGGREVAVIILDGSEEPLRGVDDPATNIAYIHLKKSLAQRIAHAAAMVRTKYVIILPDDELYVPSALEGNIRFLDEHPDYSSCKGLCVSFRKNLYSSKVEAVSNNDRLRSYQVVAATPCKRMEEHLFPYTIASIYAVHRVEVFQKIAELLQLERNYSCAAALEFQVSLVVAWMGKIHVLDQLMWLRSLENRNISWCGNPLDPGVWLSDPKYASEILQFGRDFATLFPAGDDGNTSESCVLKALSDFGVERLALLQQNKIINIFEILYTEIWGRLGEPLRSMIRPLLKRNRPLLEMAEELRSTGVVVDMDEIGEMVSFLMRFDATA